MELRSAAAGIVVLAISCLTACGTGTGTPSPDDGDDVGSAAPTVDLQPFTPVPVPEATNGTGPITDGATLAGRMISIADLPAGYTGYDLPPLDPSAPGATAEDRSGTEPQECAAVLAPVGTQVPGVLASASVTYGGPDFSSLDQDAASYDGSGALTAFRTVQESLTRCAEFSGTDADGVRVDYRLGMSPLLADDAIGDASVAVRLAATSEGVSLTTDAVVMVVGSTVTQVVATGIEAVDPQLITSLARTAADRLR